MFRSRGGTGVQTPLKHHKKYRFLSNTDPDPLKNHKATKPAFNIGSSSARQRIKFLESLLNSLLLLIYRYHGFFEEQDSLRKFRQAVLSRNNDVHPTSPQIPTSCDSLRKIRRRVWNIVDNQEASFLAKVNKANFFLASDFLCYLIIIIAQSFDSDQDRQNVVLIMLQPI